MVGIGTFDTYGGEEAQYEIGTTFDELLVLGFGLETVLSRTLSLDVSVELSPQQHIVPREEGGSYGHLDSHDPLLSLDIYAAPSRNVEENLGRRAKKTQYIGTITLDDAMAHVTVASGHSQLEPIIRRAYNDKAPETLPPLR